MRSFLPLAAGLMAAFVGLSACTASGAGQAYSGAGASGPRADVVRQGQTITVRYQLDRDAPVWVFSASALMSGSRRPWRPEQWTVLTPGVVLDRVGHFDVLRAENGGTVPRTVDIQFRPRSVDLEADYPTLVFSNGAVAVPTRQMTLFPAEGLGAVAELPADLSGVAVPVPPTQVRWRNEDGTVVYGGQRRPLLTTQFENTYVLLGDARITRDDALTAVIDPALPSWLAQTLADAAPAMGQWYMRRLGPVRAGGQQPVLMAAWNRPDASASSMSGSVLPGLIVTSFEGRGIGVPDEEIRQRALWFVAHESAHFWLGQTVRYAHLGDSWITEGGADLMAVRALQAAQPGYDANAELQREVDDCVARASSPVAMAAERGDHRAFYACGAVFSLAAEAALNRYAGGDFIDFVGLILRRSSDGTINADGWMALYGDVGGSPRIAQAMRRVIDSGSADPAGDIALILSQTGARREGGRVLLAGGQDRANG